MSEFKTYTLDQLCIVGSSKRVHLSDYVQQGIPFYRSKEVIELSSGKNISEQLFISSEKYSEIKSKFPVPQENDVLITAVGTIGEILVVKDPNFYFKDGNLIWLRNINFEIIDIDYLYYFLKSDLFQKTIKYNNIGAVQKALTIDFLKTVKITLPSLDNQRKLISVLKSIDKKLRINNQINQELEAMAKTLYDYWFVQFDFPDQNGKPYKSSDGRMVYHPGLKREIPEGWGVESVKDFESNIITGKTPSRKNSDNFGGKIPFITIGDIRGNTFVYSTSETLTDLGASVQNNKYLPQDSLCVSCIATVGEIGFTTEPSHTNQQINSIVFEDETNRYYLYFALKNYFENANASAKTGNTFANMNKEDFSGIKIIFPNKEIKNNFHKITETYFSQIKCLQGQNQQLTQLRDWLLPMLMNGQVKVE